MPILKKKTELESVISEVHCPFDALKVDGQQCICTFSTKIYKKSTGDVSLGNIKQDILEHCARCEYKKRPQDFISRDNAEPASVKLDIDSFGNVKCPENKEDVSVLETCKTCQFFGKEKLKQLKKSEGNSFKLTHSFCHYPNIPLSNMKLFLDEKSKKDPRAGIVRRD